MLESQNNLAPSEEKSSPATNLQESKGGATSCPEGSRKFIKYNKRIIYLGTLEYLEFRKAKRNYLNDYRSKNVEKVKQYERLAWVNNRAGRTASHRKYVAKNKAKVYAKSREWDDKNKDRTNSRRRERYSDKATGRRERVLSAQKVLRQKNGRKWNEKRREIRQQNLDKFRAIGRAIYRQHRHLFIAKAKARTFRKRGATIGDIRKIAAWEGSWKSKELVTCYWCLGKFSPSECETEHMHPLCVGGLHSLDNLCVSCKRCNDYKAGKPLLQWNNLIINPTLQLGENIL